MFLFLYHTLSSEQVYGASEGTVTRANMNHDLRNGSSVLLTWTG